MYKAVLCALLAISFHAFADDDPEIKTLCDHGLEGSAIASVVGVQYRMNLICVTDGKMTGTSYEKGLGNTNLTYSFVEHATSLELSQISLDDAADSSDATNFTLAHLNIAKLMAGDVEGWYINGQLTRESLISGKVDQHFPPLSTFPSLPTNETDLNGTYDLKVLYGGRMENAEINLRVARGILRARMKVDGLLTNFMVEGPKYDGSGRFKATTASGNGEKTGKEIYSIRGYMTGPGQAMIYWINPQDGIVGPFAAKRVFKSDDLFVNKNPQLNQKP